MKVKTLIERLQTLPPDMPCAAAIWLPEDVESVAEDAGFELSEEKIAEVLDEVDKEQDAERGITWIEIERRVNLVLVRAMGFAEKHQAILVLKERPAKNSDSTGKS